MLFSIYSDRDSVEPRNGLDVLAACTDHAPTHSRAWPAGSVASPPFYGRTINSVAVVKISSRIKCTQKVASACMQLAHSRPTIRTGGGGGGGGGVLQSAPFQPEVQLQA